MTNEQRERKLAERLSCVPWKWVATIQQSSGRPSGHESPDWAALARAALAFCAEQQTAPLPAPTDEELGARIAEKVGVRPSGEDWWVAAARAARELLPQPARCTEGELAEVLYETVCCWIGPAMPVKSLRPGDDLTDRYKAQARAAAAHLGVPLAPEPQQGGEDEGGAAGLAAPDPGTPGRADEREHRTPTRDARDPASTSQPLPEPRSAAAMERQPPAPTDEELALELRRAFQDFDGLDSLEDCRPHWLRTLARARELLGQEAARLREERDAAQAGEVIQRTLAKHFDDDLDKAERERDDLAQRLFETSEELAQARAELGRRERVLRWRVSRAIDRAFSDAPTERP